MTILNQAGFERLEHTEGLALPGGGRNVEV
jgi:hypothetical protein